MKITRRVFDTLTAELSALEASKHKLAADIADARGFGDLSENAEYDAARKEQSRVFGRINEISGILRSADVVDAGHSAGKIEFGSVFTVLDEETGTPLEFQLVSTIEADPISGKVSDVSPFGMKAQGKSVGDSFEVKAPAGVFKYTVIAA